MERLCKEDKEHNEQSWGQHLAHTVDDLVRVQREIVGHGKENRRVDQLPYRKILLREERTDANLERDRAGAWHRKERTDDEIEQDEQYRRKARPCLFAQQRRIFPARQCDRRDAKQRQTDASRHKADHRKQRMLTRRLPQRRWKDQISRAEVDGEHHKSERQKILFV